MPGENFFIESAGFGIFPELISEMQKIEETVSPSEEINFALRVLLKIVKRFKPHKATIKANGITIQGSFILVEIMNIQFLGPNIHLAPVADPGDGFLDLVMIAADGQAQLKKYLTEMINGTSDVTGLDRFIKTMRVQKVNTIWNGNKVHVDDNLITEYSGDSLEWAVVPGALEFVQNI